MAIWDNNIRLFFVIILNKKTGGHFQLLTAVKERVTALFFTKKAIYTRIYIYIYVCVCVCVCVCERYYMGTYLYIFFLFIHK